jgi:excinuclease UvrABC nuclease subunit
MSNLAKRMEELRDAEKGVPTCVYFIRSEDNEIIYIGISMNPMKRSRQHDKMQDWRQEIAHISVHWFENRWEAEEAEIMLIKHYRPKHNIEFNDDEPIDDRLLIKTGIRLQKIISAMDRKTLKDYDDAGMRKVVDVLNQYSRSDWDNVEKAIDVAREYAND